MKLSYWVVIVLACVVLLAFTMTARESDSTDVAAAVAVDDAEHAQLNSNGQTPQREESQVEGGPVETVASEAHRDADTEIHRQEALAKHGSGEPSTLLDNGVTPQRSASVAAPVTDATASDKPVVLASLRSQIPVADAPTHTLDVASVAVSNRRDVVQDKDEEQPADDSGDDAPQDQDKLAGDGADEKAAADEEEADEQPQDKTESADENSDEKSASDKSDDNDDESEEKPDGDADKETKKKERKTHKVEAKRFKIDVELEGKFVAEDMTEVPLRPEAWSNFEIDEVVEHGARVHTGDVLIKFDDTKLNEAIADLEIDQRLSELSIIESEQELTREEKTISMDFDDAKRLNQEAKEDYQYYKEVQRPLMIETANFNRDVAEYYLNYERDELEQLEKMYEADDLTEETEEIILTRQRKMVEFYEFLFKQATISRDRTLDVLIPRTDIQIEEILDRSEIQLGRATTSKAVDLNRSRYQLEKKRQSRAKSLDRHAKLLVDRGLMEIKAPADGVVYYGRCVDGNWSETASLINKLQPHMNASPNSVLMTIVQQRPLHVLATLPEAKRADVAVGQAAKVATPAELSDKIDSRVAALEPTPINGSRFQVRLDLLDSDLPDWLVAGMSCKIKVNVHDEPDAIVVPAKAIHSDEYDEDEKYVWVVDPEDDEAEPERRTVKLGHKKGDDVEVVKGLKPGEVVSLEDEEKKDDEDKND